MPDIYPHNLRDKIYTIVFEADTKAGKTFDIFLIWMIILSVLTVIVDSAIAPGTNSSKLFYIAEWFFTIIFTIEYLLRIYATRRPLGYIFSFYGLVDLVSIVPTYLSLFVIGGQYLLVVRILRLLRVFRLFKLSHFVSEGDLLKDALRASRTKIIVFLFAVLNVVVIIGALMYLVEGPKNGFTNIPVSMYWAIVTLTTVGYGDISPHTPLGQFMASVVMIIGYGIIAIPTGIVTAELTRGISNKEHSNIACPVCNALGHDTDAEFCKRCGNKL